MTLVEEYYELNEAEEVPAIWKILQIGFYGISAGLGLWCGFTMATLRLKFGDRCYLFTTESNYVVNSTSVSDLMWESDTLCDYYQFSFVSSFIVGVIWAALFLMCGKGGRSLTGFVPKSFLMAVVKSRRKKARDDPIYRIGTTMPPNEKFDVFQTSTHFNNELPQPWRIIWPSLIFNLIYFLAVLGTSVKIQEGTHNFCQRKDKNSEDCIPVYMLVKDEDVEMTTFQINTVPKTAWGCTMSWLALFLLSLFRILFLVDFRLYKICVFKIDDTIQNRKEEVLKVTNYEEPKRINFSGELLTRSHFGPSDDRKLDIKPISKRPNGKFKSINPTFQPNTAFYIMTDKMMGRHGKPKISARAGDEAFSRNLPLNSRVANSQSQSKEFEDQAFFRNYENDEDLSMPSTTQKISFKEDFDTSGSESEILVRNFDQNESMLFKKLI